MSATYFRGLEMQCSNLIMVLPSIGSPHAYNLPANEWEIEALIHFASRIRDAAAKRATQEEEAAKSV